MSGEKITYKYDGEFTGYYPAERQRTRMRDYDHLCDGMVLFLVTITSVFVILKLAGEISWSWWFVTAPLWATTGVCCTLFVLIGGCMVIFPYFFGMIHHWEEKRKEKKKLEKGK